MIILHVVGVVSDECPKCIQAVEALRIRFKDHGVQLEFALVHRGDSEEDFQMAKEKFGLNDPPSFSIFGDIYSGLFFAPGKVEETVRKLREWSNTQL